MPKGRPSKSQSESFEGRATAIAFKEKYFPTLTGFKPAPSIFPGHFGIVLRDATVYFRETPITHNIVAGVIGADESFKTITTSIFSVKDCDGNQLLQLALRWGDSYYSVWQPYTDSNCKRMKHLASEIIQGVTENVLAFNHISKLNVKVILRLISDRIPHATIVPAGIMTDELIEFTGDLNNVHKEIDRFLRPGLSLLGEVPPLKSKERLAQDAEEARLFCEKYTLEERHAIADKMVEEQSIRGGNLVYKNLFGKTWDELQEMPFPERIAFMENAARERQEREDKLRAEAKQKYQEMLEEAKNNPVKPVEVKKTRKSRKTQKQGDTD